MYQKALTIFAIIILLTGCAAQRISDVGDMQVAEGENIDGDKQNSDWIQVVSKRVKANIIYSNTAQRDKNVIVDYLVELLPDGTVKSVELRRTSGLPEFDEAVRLAVYKSQPYPPKKNGIVPSHFPLTWGLGYSVEELKVIVP